MVNPILNNRKYFSFYLILWGILSLIHVSIVYYLYNFGFFEALADGVIFNLIYALLALLVWFVVRYSDLKNQGWLSILINHTGTAAVITFIWVYVSGILLKYTFEFSEEYYDFLSHAVIWRYITGVMLYLVVILFYYLFIYYADLQIKIKQESELQLLLKESELSALKSQINPHFLFNSLNSISSLTLSDPKRAQQMIIKLSEYLRYSLAHDEKKIIKFSTELDNAITYLEIEKIRFGDKLIIENKVEANCLEHEIPAMILQPVYENAIKHGVYESTGNVTIYTHCYCENNQMHLNIRNNFDPSAIQRKGAGIGIKNVKHRMKLIYDRSDLVTILKSNDSYEIEFIFP